MPAKIPKKFERWINRELVNVKTNLVMRNSDVDYEVFGKFRIISGNNKVDVYDRSGLIAQFSSKKVALAWCTAGKFNLYDLATQIKITDQYLYTLKNDVKVRLAIAERGKKAQFRRDLMCKIENKLIKQKQLELRLQECVNLAKYYQQRGFNNETSRAS